MKLTKEECLDAYMNLAHRTGTKQCEKNIVCEECENQCETRKRYERDCLLIEQLINEHFDNPQLTFDELKQMKGQPVWNTYLKEWIIVKDVDESFMRTFITIVTKDGELEITFDCEKLTDFCRKRVE